MGVQGKRKQNIAKQPSVSSQICIQLSSNSQFI